MLDEALGLLLSRGDRGPAAEVFVDCTFGAGGYARAVLQHAPLAKVVAIDADRAAWERAQALAAEHPGRVVPVHANFADLDRALEAAGVAEVDGVIYDLGLSSLQLADPARGFSFSTDAPLDMRFDPQSGRPTAADLLAASSEADLAKIIFSYGDERNARRIARSIVRRRERSPLMRTGDLVAAVLSSLPAGSKRRHAPIHPATRTFQALRIAVNDELRALERSLEAAVRRLVIGGRIVALSFHSGEDRIVKRTFVAWRGLGVAEILTPKPLQPSEAEVARNPRSRSAKLRAARKVADATLGAEQVAA